MLSKFLKNDNPLLLEKNLTKQKGSVKELQIRGDFPNVRICKNNTETVF
jgi:hypothetical protein